ncbi:type 1 fimbrial protein [Salmonella enterica]|nr:type 1 fimbrial protein [Salmonella enterica]
MKKSMAGQGVAGALLLAGLMVSAGAMAASGDPVTGGSGTVTINVPIVTSTCSVSVPTEVNLDPVNQNSLYNMTGTFIESKNFDAMLSNCKDKTLQMSVQGHNISSKIVSKGYFSSGDPEHALDYGLVAPKSAEITGSPSYNGSEQDVYLDNTYPLTIKPSSDNYPISFKINLFRNNDATNYGNLGSAVSGGFDYTFTYQ